MHTSRDTVGPQTGARARAEHARHAPLVSVVTPVYNGEEYLRECAESVLRQTYRHWEYVIVDNRSTDGTARIAAEYAGRDPRVRVESPRDFLGADANYNRAMGLISPDSAYCKPLGADDWLYPECLERMVAVAEAHPSVAIVGAYRLDGDRVGLDGLPYDREVFRGRDVVRRSLLGGPYVTGSPTSTLIRSDVIRARKEFYDLSITGSDTDACYRILGTADLGFVHQVLTFTRRSPEAQSTRAARLQTYTVDNLRCLARYGRDAMGRREYRRFVALELLRYGRYLVKQAIKLRPWREPDFREFHLGGMAQLAEELGPDTISQALLAGCRRIVAAPSPHPGSRRSGRRP